MNTRIFSDFSPATPEIECVDVWPVGRLTAAKMAAYDRAAREGSIRPLKVYRDPNTGKTAVRYLSAIPHPWMLEELRRIAETGEQTQLKEGEE